MSKPDEDTMRLLRQLVTESIGSNIEDPSERCPWCGHVVTPGALIGHALANGALPRLAEHAMRSVRMYTDELGELRRRVAAYERGELPPVPVPTGPDQIEPLPGWEDRAMTRWRSDETAQSIAASRRAAAASGPAAEVDELDQVADQVAELGATTIEITDGAGGAGVGLVVHGPPGGTGGGAGVGLVVHGPPAGFVVGPVPFWGSLTDEQRLDLIARTCWECGTLDGCKCTKSRHS